MCKALQQGGCKDLHRESSEGDKITSRQITVLKGRLLIATHMICCHRSVVFNVAFIKY